MTVTIAIIVGLIISGIIIYGILNPYALKPKKGIEYEDLVNRTQERIAKANGALIEQFSLKNQSDDNADFYKDAEFVNKECTSLDDFIINDQINSFDLRKLADLNGIQLQIAQGWHALLIEMLQELDAKGWDRRVSCIKEKYASLRFYTRCEYNDPIFMILEHYEYKSEQVCETCGEKGEMRHNSGWDYIACQLHYTENRGKVTVEDSGFTHNGTFYPWNDIKDAVFEDADYYKKYRFLKIALKKTNVQHPGWSDNTLYVSRHVIGFGNFLNHLPKQLQSLDYTYIKNFEQAAFCEVCGYKAVYFEECECCEKRTWLAYLKEFNDNDSNEERIRHLKYSQMNWTKKEGEKYEMLNNNYSKNPDYTILYTEEELNKSYKDEEDELYNG
ncbi:hypothetical protein [Flavobacterium cerinum]|uniref:Uncharacterized protein n=1 Tax=Flavobacterium cerinum TaxID=2502784 RepID=A0ABY5INZ7_9FLAO|nr:hypothetical protein [Flavobacterium cerinum]UUC44562.1 hypothetical protein NOX80_13080 [Flavobacterium cerinum]